MEQLIVANQSVKKIQLQRNLPLAIGMRVLVTLNINTDADLANGARGTIVGFILHPEEQFHDENTVTLQRTPLCVFVKLDRTRMPALPGLEHGVVPIEPVKKSFSISYVVERQGGDSHTMTTTKIQKTVQRQQFPITGAYAFTDYRSQGQTIKTVIVDLAKPPTGGDLSLFNVYVALSRSSGRETIRLLRNMEDSVLHQSIDDHLVSEDQRLQELDTLTKATWNELGSL